MLKTLTITLLCLALTAAFLLGVTLSIALQGPALILLGLAAVSGGVLAVRLNPSPRLLLPILAGVGYFVARAFLSPVIDLGQEDLFLILGAAIVYLLLGLTIDSPKARVAAALVMILLLCLHLGSVLQQLLGGEGYSLVRLFTSGIRPEGNKITGMYGYIGSFANFAAIAGTLALCLGVWGRFPKFFRVALLVLSVLGFSAVCIAQSRSAMVGMGAGGLVLIVLLWISVAHQGAKTRTIFRACLLALGGAGLALGVVGAVWVFNARALKANGSEVVFDSEVRLGYWSMAVEQFIEHPIIGAGSRSYSYECFHYWSPNLDTGEANPEFVHNEYLQLLADYGIIGFIIVAGLLGGHFFFGVSQVRALSGRVSQCELNKGSNAMALAIAGVTGMAIMGVHVISDFRTHLLANLLLLVCCMVWVLPLVRQQERGGRKWSGGVLAALLVLLGIVAVMLGTQQLRGGMPLLKNKMATETGTWFPTTVHRDVWIPALEESNKLAPSYRRHLRLGTLYRLEAEELAGSQHKVKLEQAIEQYRMAEARHPYDPVAKLNLAVLYTYFKNFELAQSYYQKADEMASSRERWFRIRTKWADMQRQWAGHLWKSGKTESAEAHYLHALRILREGKVHSSDTIYMRFMVVIEYCRMLDTLKRYGDADEIFEVLEKKSKLYHINSLRLNIRREMGEHYLRHAKNLWYQRQPEAAYAVLLKSKKSYRIHQVVLKGKKDPAADAGFREVEQILDFFKNTGVGDGK